MAEYCAVSIKALHRLPKNLTYDEGAFTETVGVALYAIERVKVRPGDEVLVIGPGAIGLVVTQIARAKGAGRVVLAGTRDQRLSIGKRLGEDEVVNVPKSHDPVSQIKSVFDGKGPHVVVEVAGSEAAGNLAIQAARRGGRIVLAGSTSPGRNLSVDLSLIVRGHLDIYGSVADPRGICSRGLELVSRGYVNVNPLMTGSYRLEEFGKALQAYRERREGAFRVMIHPNATSSKEK